MNCEEHQRTINRFVDHEIKATGCAELFEHLGKCGECQEFFDSLMKLNLELDKQVAHTSLDQFDETKRFHERLATHSMPARYALAFLRHRFSVPTPVVALVAVGLMAFALIFLNVPQNHTKSASVRQAPEVQITTLPVVDLR